MEDNNLGLPEHIKHIVDKYFTRTRFVLEADNTNPRVSLKIFARGDGPINGLDETLNVFHKYLEEHEQEQVDIWVTEKDEFQTKEPLMVIEGPAQSLVELETTYLGVLSHHLTDAHPDYEVPDPEEFGEKVREVTDIYDEIGVPLLYFGARHYHPMLDKQLAGAALENGAVQTSTDIGSSNIGKKGVGTTPHFLTLILAHEYGKENATRKTAELFHKHMDPDIPRTILIDTFNREIDDALDVVDYFEQIGYFDDGGTVKFRVDTCGENHAQGMDPEDVDPDDDYRTGRGVRIEPVKELRKQLIETGYGDQTELILSSGFGNPDKARAFVDAYEEFEEETLEQYGESYELFSGIGAGSFADGIHCTADIFAADGEPLAKTGREIELEEIEQYLEENMVKAL